ncbi:alcohol dehydrogenase, partial [Klebsiella pneumoniae]
MAAISTGTITDAYSVKPSPKGTVAKLAMRQPFVLFKGLTFQ